MSCNMLDKTCHFGGLYSNCSGPLAVGLECSGSSHITDSEVQSCDSCKCVMYFTGYPYASRFISNCATSSITVWSALHQLTFRNSAFLLGKLCSVSGYVLPLTMTSMSHVSQQTSLFCNYPQLWNQLPVTTLATSADTSDCFKRALKTFLFQ